MYTEANISHDAIDMICFARVLFLLAGQQRVVRDVHPGQGDVAVDTR